MQGPTALELNETLAYRLGWTNLFPIGSALLGTPPDGGVNSRGQALVPDWCGDWVACGPLMTMHFPVSIRQLDLAIWRDHITPWSDIERDNYVRQMIVRAVIQHLDATAKLPTVTGKMYKLGKEKP